MISETIQNLYSSDTTAFKKQMKVQATQCQNKMYSITDKVKLKRTPFIESDLQDFTVVALNVLCADPYNGYQRISGLGSLCNVIFTLHFQTQTNELSLLHGTETAEPQFFLWVVFLS